MSVQVTILGCGSSAGVPRLGTGWGACDPSNPRNRRRRCSILIEKQGAKGKTSALVDASPDLREQLLGVGVDRLDGLIITHDHADHTHGIDDVRPIVMTMRRKLPTYIDERTSGVLNRRFDYVFRTPNGSDYPPILDEVRITDGEHFTITGEGGDLEIIPFDVHHGAVDALGLRLGGMAYTPDVNGIPERSLKHLENLDVWIIDALRPRPHPSHFSLDEALAWIERMKPRRAILTNMHNDLDYESLRRSLPSNIEPAYDGMSIES